MPHRSPRPVHPPLCGGDRSPADANVAVTCGRGPQNEPSVAVSLVDSRHILVTANDARRGAPRIGLYRSTDGGVSFRQALLPLPAGFTAASDGVVAAAFPSDTADPARGRFLVAGLAYRRPTGDGTLIAYRSRDGGATFRGPVLVNRGLGNLIFDDKPALAIDRSPASPYIGSAYVSYTRFIHRMTGSVLFFQRSRDLGRRWSRPVRLTALKASVQGSAVAVGPRGEVYVAWIHLGPGRPRLRLRRSDNGGASFGRTVTVAEIRLVPSPLPVPGWRFRTPTFAFLATDISGGPAGGTVYAVWQDFRNGDADVLLARSTDRGATWSAPLRVSDSPKGAQDFFPAIATLPDTGAVNVIYYTNRLARERLDVFVASGPPGGTAFPIQRRVTDFSFDPNADRRQRRFLGDYIGVAPLPPDGILAVWTDTRTGRQHIFAGE